MLTTDMICVNSSLAKFSRTVIVTATSVPTSFSNGNLTTPREYSSKLQMPGPVGLVGSGVVLLKNVSLAVTLIDGSVVTENTASSLQR